MNSRKMPLAAPSALVRADSSAAHQSTSALAKKHRCSSACTSYDDGGELVGGLGVSGDESCTDHVVAWRVRHTLNLDNVPAGVTDANDDNIVHDLSVDPATGRKQSAGGYGHPTCSPTPTKIAQELSESQPIGPED